jgi:hypothetical protein
MIGIAKSEKRKIGIAAGELDGYEKIAWMKGMFKVTKVLSSIKA